MAGGLERGVLRFEPGDGKLGLDLVGAGQEERDHAGAQQADATRGERALHVHGREPFGVNAVERDHHHRGGHQQGDPPGTATGDAERDERRPGSTTRATSPRRRPRAWPSAPRRRPPPRATPWSPAPTRRPDEEPAGSRRWSGRPPPYRRTRPSSAPGTRPATRWPWRTTESGSARPACARVVACPLAAPIRRALGVPCDTSFWVLHDPAGLTGPTPRPVKPRLAGPAPQRCKISGSALTFVTSWLRGRRLRRSAAPPVSPPGRSRPSPAGPGGPRRPRARAQCPG